MTLSGEPTIGKRVARPGHDVGLHESDDLGAIALHAPRIDRVVRRVGDPGRRAVQSGDNRDERRSHHGDRGQRFALSRRRHARLPGHRLAQRLGVRPRARIRGHQRDERGQLRAAADIAEDDGGPSGIVGMNVDGREAEDALKSGLRAVDVADVIERELVGWGGDAEVGKKRAAARPQPPLERTLHVEP
jgi:hypothetical protein